MYFSASKNVTAARISAGKQLLLRNYCSVTVLEGKIFVIEKSNKQPRRQQQQRHQHAYMWQNQRDNVCKSRHELI